MALVAPFNLKLPYIDVKTAVLNGQLCGAVYISQPKSFDLESKKHIVCKLKGSPIILNKPFINGS